MKQLLLGSVCALACAALSTMQAQASVAGSVSADYNYNAWDSSDYSMGELRGAILTALNYDNLSVQGNAQYQYVARDNSIGTFSGSVFWTGQDSRIAVTVQNEQWEGFDPWSAGIGAEVFISPEWTLAAHAGAWWQIYSSNFGAGSYAGAKATYYWNPNLAFSGQIDYTSLPDYYYYGGNDIEFTARAEYLWCEDLAVFGGYTYGDVDSSPVNSFTIGLKYFINDGATTLVGHQRTGEMDYPVTFQPIWFHH